MINLQSNYPILAGQHDAWTGQLHTAVDRFAAGSARLPPFGGTMANREIAAQWLGLPVERTWICTSGHHGSMTALLAAGLPGKAVAVESITYPWFLRQASMLGVRIVPVALDREAIDPDALRAACREESIAAVYTMPSMHNPTGAVASASRRSAVVAVAREFGLTVIEDGAYGFLLPDEPPRYTTLAPERAFYIESLSKRVVPGLRTCFLAAPAALAESTALALRVTSSGSSTLLTSMGCAMAADGSLARTIQAKRVEGARRTAASLAILREQHPRLTVHYAPNGWHLWVELPGAWTPETAESTCEQHGVLITGAHWFTAPGIPVQPFVRLGLGGETEWDRVVEGVRIFSRLIA